MIKEAVCHKMDKEFVYAIEKGKYVIKLRTKKDDVTSVYLAFCDKYLNKRGDEEGTIYQSQMHKSFSDELFDYYEIILDSTALCVRYFFILKDDKEVTYYGNYHFFSEPISDLDYMFDFSTAVKDDELFIVPSWAKGSIVYQIFVDRFARDKGATDESWYELPVLGTRKRYGGTLKGITSKLDYLENLGVEVLYLTPIFQSNTDHKYVIEDYLKIDTDFGKKRDLKELITKAHEKGIRIILDGVFNHTSVMFFAFQDVLKKQQKSEYKDWYYINKFPVKFEFDKQSKVLPNYLTFGYSAGMPKLNTTNPKVKEYIFKVVKTYLDMGIDGYRLDVADEIPHSFWKEFRKYVKSISQDALIIGEVWHESSEWLKGDEFDTVMNYEFNKSVERLCLDKKYKCSDFINDFNYVNSRLNVRIRNLLWNLIDSHDTPRFLTKVGGKKKILKFALALQMVLPGMPMIYYGDEVGMVGEDDPDCRRGMLWDKDKIDEELFSYYKHWIKIRKDNEALKLGQLIIDDIDDENRIIHITRKYFVDQIKIEIDAKKFEVKIIEII